MEFVCGNNVNCLPKINAILGDGNGEQGSQKVIISVFVLQRLCSLDCCRHKRPRPVDNVSG